MLERFNFYDIYGYVIPGATLIGLVLVPDAVQRGETPSADVGDILLYLLLAYLVGHLLHLTIRAIAPHAIPARDLLDPGDKSIGAAAKQRLFAAIRDRFSLDAADAAVREDAFQLCRAALVQARADRYFEQFQSLYVMMRNVAAAFILGAFFALGWLVGLLSAEPNGPWIAITAAIASVIAVWYVFHGKWSTKAWPFLISCLAIEAAGSLHGPGACPERTAIVIAFLVLALLLAQKLLMESYQDHSKSFGRQVFVGFLALETRPPEKTN